MDYKKWWLAKANVEVVKYLRLDEINAQELTCMEAKDTGVALANAQKTLELKVLIEFLKHSAVDLAKNMNTTSTKNNSK